MPVLQHWTLQQEAGFRLHPYFFYNLPCTPGCAVKPAAQPAVSHTRLLLCSVLIASSHAVQLGCTALPEQPPEATQRVLRLLQHRTPSLSHALPLVTAEVRRCCGLSVQNLGAWRGQRRLSFSKFSNRARPACRRGGAGADGGRQRMARHGHRARARAGRGARAAALCAHAAPYDGPPKEEVLALRKRFLNPCAPALLRPPCSCNLVANSAAVEAAPVCFFSILPAM